MNAPAWWHRLPGSKHRRIKKAPEPPDGNRSTGVEGRRAGKHVSELWWNNVPEFEWSRANSVAWSVCGYVFIHPNSSDGQGWPRIPSSRSGFRCALHVRVHFACRKLISIVGEVGLPSRGNSVRYVCVGNETRERLKLSIMICFSAPFLLLGCICRSAPVKRATGNDRPTG